MIRNSEKTATNAKRKEEVSLNSVDRNHPNPNKMINENILQANLQEHM